MDVINEVYLTIINWKKVSICKLEAFHELINVRNMSILGNILNKFSEKNKRMPALDIHFVLHAVWGNWLLLPL